MDGIAKQKLHVMLVVDTSSSMRGERIKQVNTAVKEIKDYLIDLQGENVNVDFYVSILTFGTDTRWINGSDGENVQNMQLTPIKAGGYSNLHLAYKELTFALEKQSKGGMMPDFGGVAPIILLLTDGHPTKGMREELAKLQQKAWFKVALKYGIAIGLDDARTKKVLTDFVGKNGDVLTCFNANMLQKIIQVVVMTASKVKSQSTGAGMRSTTESVVQEVRQQVGLVLKEVDDWEW